MLKILKTQILKDEIFFVHASHSSLERKGKIKRNKEFQKISLKDSN